MKYQTRRGFLTAGGGAIAALGLRSIGGCGPDEGVIGPVPVEDTPENTLDVVFADFTFDTKTQGTITARLRTYGGKLPGQTISTHPGDTLKILVRNFLTEEKEKDEAGHHEWMKLPERMRHVVPHMFNMTNLHVHGLETVPHLFSPLGTSDPAALMVSIEPGKEQRYVFPIPPDHAPGLYWYHPHHHGSTAVQVQNGMAGGIIVKGAIDEVPEIKAAQDIPLVVQDVCLFPPPPGKKDGPWMYSPTQNAIWQTFQGPVKPGSDVMGAILLRDKDGNTLQQQGSDGQQYTPKGELDPALPWLGSGFSTGDCPLRLFLVNGTLVYEEAHNSTGPDPTMPLGQPHGAVPRYTLRPGEVVRFRLLNGCSDNMIPLVVEGHPIHLLAMDGVNFPTPSTREVFPVNKDSTKDPELAKAQVVLGPGNRAEFLVKGSISPGVYGIWQNAHRGQFLNSEAKLLANIEILDEAPKDMPLPTKLPAPSRHYPLIPEGSYKQRNIFFGMQGPPSFYNKIVGIDFFMTTDPNLADDDTALNTQATWEGTDPSAKLGLSYMEDRVDLSDMKVGTVEEWTIHDNSHLMHNTMANGSKEGHPFHLHETSFEVIKIDGVAVDQIILQDTVWVPHGKSVTIRMHIKENAVGKSVLHCHIIPHEESGMMMNTLVSR